MTLENNTGSWQADLDSTLFTTRLWESGQIYAARLPSTFKEGPVSKFLSLDSQAYFVCRQCDNELRVNPSLCYEAPSLCLMATCAKNDPTLEPVVHAYSDAFECLDCFSSAVYSGASCPSCASTNGFRVGFVIAPPYRRRFIEMSLPGRGHEWGRDGAADAAMVIRQSKASGFLTEAQTSADW